MCIYIYIYIHIHIYKQINKLINKYIYIYIYIYMCAANAAIAGGLVRREFTKGGLVKGV